MRDLVQAAHRSEQDSSSTSDWFNTLGACSMRNNYYLGKSFLQNLSISQDDNLNNQHFMYRKE